MSLPPSVGRYRIDRVLGSGAFASVWLGHDDALDSPVAIKVLSPSLIDDLDVRNRFLEEARILRRADSERLIRVHDIGELDDGRPYFVMPYADGGTLAERMRRRKLTVDEALALAEEVAHGVEVINRLGIIHRDLKPSNVLFQTAPDGSERLLLADLGLAKALAHASGAFTLPVGTPGYMSPEQARFGGGLDVRADVYGLGALTYHLVTGKAPGPAPVKVPPSQLRNEIEPNLDRVILRALEVERDLRWPTAEAFAQALASLPATSGQTHQGRQGGQGTSESGAKPTVVDQPIGLPSAPATASPPDRSDGRHRTGQERPDADRPDADRPDTDRPDTDRPDDRTIMFSARRFPSADPRPPAEPSRSADPYAPAGSPRSAEPPTVAEPHTPTESPTVADLPAPPGTYGPRDPAAGGPAGPAGPTGRSGRTSPTGARGEDDVTTQAFPHRPPQDAFPYGQGGTHHDNVPPRQDGAAAGAGDRTAEHALPDSGTGGGRRVPVRPLVIGAAVLAVLLVAGVLLRGVLSGDGDGGGDAGKQPADKNSVTVSDASGKLSVTVPKEWPKGSEETWTPSVVGLADGQARPVLRATPDVVRFKTDRENVPGVFIGLTTDVTEGRLPPPSAAQHPSACPSKSTPQPYARGSLSGTITRWTGCNGGKTSITEVGLRDGGGRFGLWIRIKQVDGADRTKQILDSLKVTGP